MEERVQEWSSGQPFSDADPEPESDQQRRRRLLSKLIVSQTLAILFLSLMTTLAGLLGPEPGLLYLLPLGGIAIAGGLISYLLMRRRRFLLAGYSFLIGTCLAITVNVSIRGYQDVSGIYYLWPILCAVMLLKARGGLFIATLSMLLYLGAVLNQQLGHFIPPLAYDPQEESLLMVGSRLIIFFLLAILVWLSDQDLSLALKGTQQAAEKWREINQMLGRRNRELLALQSAGANITATLDLATVLRNIAEQMGQAVDSTSAYICSYETEKEEMVVVAGYASPQATPQEQLSVLGSVYQPQDAGFAHKMEAGLHTISSLDDPELYEADRIYMEQHAVQTILYVPLQAKDQLIGYAELRESRQPRQFTSEEIALCQGIARQAAVAVVNAGLYAAVEQHAVELEAVRQASLSLTSSLQLQAVLETILDSTLSLLNQAKNAHIYLYQDDKLIFGAAYWDDNHQDRPFAEPRPDGLMASVARQKEAIVIPDMRDHALFTDTPPDWKGGIVGLPLQFGDRVVGVMSVSFPRPFTIPETELRVLNLLADQAAVAIENARLHRQVQRHTTELEQQVMERTRDLSQANERLKELDQLKSKFISDVSHELRTPLTNLVLYLDLMERGKPEKQLEYMAILRAKGDQLVRLTEDILQFSGLGLFEGEATLAAIDLNEIVLSVLPLYQEQAEKSGLSLTFEAGSSLPPLLADRDQLVHAFSNLLDNAIAYTSDGGITVSTSLDAAGKAILLQISDSGMGIPAAELPHIFDRFYRGQHISQLSTPGSGLGLAMVKEIIELHRGSLTVESEVGKGTTFKLRFPLAEADPLPNGIA
jgi:signal transduction histidine kinase